MERFNGKLAVVTGGCSGMGKEVAICLAAEGAKVIVLDISSPCEFENPSITYRKHDVADPAAWESLALELAARGGVDYLVSAAGVIDYEPLDEVTMSNWKRTMAIDVDGVMLGMRSLIPLMKERGGAIVNFSSAWGLVAVSGLAAYHAAKGAVTSLTRNAAITYGEYNVRVNAIHPGCIATPMVLRQPPELNETFIARTPLGRMGTPQELAKCVLFMLSDDAAFMTGAAMVVDGGWTAQ